MKELLVTRRAQQILLAYYLLALIAVFWIPTFVPVKPSVSDSYLFGYNNQTGFLLILLLASVGALWAARFDLPFRAAKTAGDLRKVSRRTLIVSLAISLLAYLFMYWFTHRLGGFGESANMLDHIELVSEGKTPFRDFGFGYGLSFLYGPVLLSRLLHINIVDAYYILLTITALMGIALLYAVINWIDYPSEHRTTIFIFYVAIAVPSAINTGIYYTLFRYLPLVFCALVVHRVWMGGGRTPGRQTLSCLLVVLFTTAILLISPEMGIAYALGSVTLFTVYGKLGEPWRLVSYLGMLIGLAAVFRVGDEIGIFDDVRAVSGGGVNFPIIPAPSVLLLLFCIGLSACYVFFRFRQGGPPDNTISIIAVATPALAGALGRCDPGHIAFNAVGILLVSSFYLSGFRKLWPWYRSAFIIFIIILPFLSGLWLYRGLLSNAVAQLIVQHADGSSNTAAERILESSMVRHFGKDRAEARLELLKQQSLVRSSLDLHALYPDAHGVVQVPFAYIPNGFGAYHSQTLDEGYYFGLTYVLSPQQVAAKIAEIQRYPERNLLLPEDFTGICQVDASSGRRLIQILLVYPFFGHAVHPQSITQPLCSFISDHYRVIDPPTPQRFGYGLWNRQN